jgi:hypothetical protein
MRWEAKVTLPEACFISLPLWYCAVNEQCFYRSAPLTLCFILSVMDGRIEQCVCIHFHMKLSKSTTETIEMLFDFWKTFFKLDSSFWMAFRFQGWPSVSWSWWTFRVTKHKQNDRKFRKNSRRLSRNNPRAPRPLGIVMEFTRKS